MKDSSSKGLGLCDVLAVVFIVLKLIGVIDWSWWWVLAPVWIPVISVSLIRFLITQEVDMGLASLPALSFFTYAQRTRRRDY